MLKPIPEFPDYFANENGEIFSRKTVGRSKKKINEPIHKINPFLSGKYWRVNLYSDGKEYKRSVAYCVLTAFISPRPDGQFIRHGIKGSLCNSLDNLCWGTKMENELDKIRDGTLKKGSQVGTAKLNELQVRIIRKAYSRDKTQGLNSYQLSKIFRIDRSIINDIINRQYWKHVP